MKTKTITVNGKTINLKAQGKSSGGFRKFRTATAIKGLGRLFIVLYLEDAKNPQAHRRPAKRSASRATPPTARPSPPPVEAPLEQLLRLLNSMTVRLNAIEGQVLAGKAPGFKAQRRPLPQASA